MAIDSVKYWIEHSTDVAQMAAVVRNFSKKELDTIGTDKWIVIDEETPEKIKASIDALQKKVNDVHTWKTGDVDTNQWHITAITNRITAIDTQLTPISARVATLQPIIDWTAIPLVAPTAAEKKEYKKLTKDRDTLDKEKLKLQQDSLEKDIWLRTAQNKFSNGTTANITAAQAAIAQELSNYQDLKRAADAVNYTDKKVEKDHSMDDDGSPRTKWFKWWKLTLSDAEDIFFHGMNYSSAEYSIDKNSIKPKWWKVKIDRNSGEITISGLRRQASMPENIAFETAVMIPVTTQIRNPTTLMYEPKTTKLLHKKKYDVTLKAAEWSQSSDTEDPQNTAGEESEKKNRRDRETRLGRVAWATWAAIAGIFGFGGKVSGSAAHLAWWAATLPALVLSKGVSVITNPARKFIDEAIVKTGKNLWNKKYFDWNSYNQNNKPTAKSRGWFIKNIAMSPYILAKGGAWMTWEVAKAPFRWTYKAFWAWYTSLATWWRWGSKNRWSRATWGKRQMGNAWKQNRDAIKKHHNITDDNYIVDVVTNTNEAKVVELANAAKKQAKAIDIAAKAARDAA